MRKDEKKGGEQRGEERREEREGERVTGGGGENRGRLLQVARK